MNGSRQNEGPGIRELFWRLTRIENNNRTIDAALRILGEDLGCALMLTDNLFECQRYAPLPELYFDLECVSRFYREKTASETISNTANETTNGSISKEEALPFNEIKAEGGLVYACHKDFIVGGDRQLYLIAISEELFISSDAVVRAAEAIQLYIELWEDGYKSNDPGALLDAVLKRDDAKALQISEAIGLDLESSHNLWILRGDFTGHSAEEKPRVLTRWANAADSLLRKKGKSAHIACRGESLFIFMEGIPYPELEEGMEQEFISYIDLSGASLTVFLELCSKEDIRGAACLHDDFIFYAGKVFPKKQIFYKHDLQFAATCKSIAADEKQISFQSLLEPLRDNKSGDVLAQTLATYLLDADSNAQKAGDLLYQHKNTIQYRLHVVRQRLNLDIKKMPASYNLYLAVGIDRLIRNA